MQVEAWRLTRRALVKSLLEGGSTLDDVKLIMNLNIGEYNKYKKEKEIKESGE
jgi:hypothetical protein